MVSEAQLRAKSKFEAKAYDKVQLRIRKDRLDDSGVSYEMVKKAAEDEKMSINSYILQAISEKINKKPKK